MPTERTVEHPDGRIERIVESDPEPQKMTPPAPLAGGPAYFFSLQLESFPNILASGLHTYTP